MVRERKRRRWLVAWGLLVAGSGCQCGTTPPATEAPADELDASGVRVESVGKEQWVARAARAVGSLQSTELIDITLELNPTQAPTHDGTAALPKVSGTWLLRAERGRLERQGLSWLDQVVVEGDRGARLTAPRALAPTREKRVELQGPVRWRQPGVTVEASAAVIDLATDVVTLEGPVRGRWAP